MSEYIRILTRANWFFKVNQSRDAENVFIRPTKVGRIMVWRVSSVCPSVNVWLFTGVTTRRINFNFTDIMHLVRPIVPFHKSQCALRYLNPMSKIQNTSSQRFLATWLTVTANEQNDDWLAPVSVVSVQPVIGWLKDGAASHWSHIVHRPRPHGNLPLPCFVRNGVWYCVKYSS